MLERDDRIAALSAELDTRHSAEAAAPRVDVEDLVLRAERAESALAHTVAQSIADLAHQSESHAAETASYEEQLIGRARVIASLEKELVRREQLVKELVSSLEESREGEPSGMVFETALPLPPARPEPALAEEVARVRTKLDELASEVARREGELVARGWRITELENECARLRDEPAKKPEGREVLATEADPDALARARDELDALRQALAQEHAARLAAESGEELARARSELARQAALLEQMRECAESS
jgi:chromosome segregation ATPase